MSSRLLMLAALPIALSASILSAQAATIGFMAPLSGPQALVGELRGQPAIVEQCLGI